MHTQTYTVIVIRVNMYVCMYCIKIRYLSVMLDFVRDEVLIYVPFSNLEEHVCVCALHVFMYVSMYEVLVYAPFSDLEEHVCVCVCMFVCITCVYVCMYV